MNFLELAENKKNSMLEDIAELIGIESTPDPKTAAAGKPMGEGIALALDKMLELCDREGFRTKNLDGYVGYAEFGPENAEQYISVLTHLDVVPAKGKWLHSPYQLSIEGEKLFGRGVIDDKGPAVASLYALKIVKDAGLPLKHRIRLIFGTDEETGNKSMDKYCMEEKASLCGFSPDADFPIVHAEKGQINTRIVLRKNRRYFSDIAIQLRSFYAGGIANMVAESAEALLAGDVKLLKDIAAAFENYCSENEINGIAKSVQECELLLTVCGKAAHGMEPEKGVHAGLELAEFLKTFKFDREDANDFISFLSKHFYHDFSGTGLGVEMSNSEMGPLTINTGIQEYNRDGNSYIHINLRFPSCGDSEGILETISQKAETSGFWVDMKGLSVKRPHLVPESDRMIEALKKAYKDITGLKPALLSTGGGTYAASIGRGVAFGPLFPGREETAHQADEYIFIDDLVKAVAIYAQSIYSLGNI